MTKVNPLMPTGRTAVIMRVQRNVIPNSEEVPLYFNRELQKWMRMDEV